MNKIRYTAVYRIWKKNLSDRLAKVKINLRLNSVKKGNFGIQEPVGDGIMELKIDYGPGYRIYYKKSRTLLLSCFAGAINRLRKRI
ncbi:MAG: type II toxin-antitoxin system RelE/ParE family toxin [Treponema sp.]|jgi:putative addiction module killer protein|nr:type II toxin-antitoxin system RelE/ParE family toxin [Treponema sp.]